MKSAVLIVSTGALLCGVGLLITWLTNGDPSLLFLWGEGLAITAGILSAVSAGRLRQPLWSGPLALMTLLGVVSICSALLSGLGRIDLFTPVPPDQFRLEVAEYAAPFVILPLAALLSALLLRPGKPKPAQPPAST